MTKHTHAHARAQEMRDAQETIHRGIEEAYDDAMDDLYCRYHISAGNEARTQTSLADRLLDAFYGALSKLG